MPTFDIVSEIDLVEVKNAVDNASRELSTRFDFRGVDASFSYADGIVTLKCEDKIFCLYLSGSSFFFIFLNSKYINNNGYNKLLIIL